MTFLNLFMLLGAAAAAIPLIIHLLNRSKYEIVNWGAMHLLDAVIEGNNRRIRLYEILLLLIRCLIPLILALCLARPLVNQFAWGGLDSGIATVVVLDDSLSMAKQNETGESRFQIAKNQIQSLAARLGDQAPLRIISTNATSPSLDAPLAGEFSMAQAITAAVEIAENDRSTAVEILVLSDFQTSNMAGLDEQTISAISNAREALPKPPAISIFPLATKPNDSAANVRVASVRVDSHRVLVGEPFGVQAEVINEGDGRLQDVIIELLENDLLIASQTVALSGGGTRQIEFEHRLDAAEPSSEINQAVRLLTVRVRTQDTCPADDYSSTVITPIQPTRVAVVSQPGKVLEGNVPANDDERAGDFVAIALSPFAFAGDQVKQRDAITAVRVPGKRLRLEELSEWDVLVLVDPGQLNEPLLQRLTQFIDEGGGLLVFAGPRMQQSLAWINENLGTGGARWFDFRLAAISKPEDGAQNSAPPLRMQTSRLEHPTMMFFNDPDNGRLTDAEFSNWLVVGDLGEQSQSLVDFSNGQPLAVETSLGKGGTIFCASTAEPSWNNLPLRPVFLPMMQQWIEYLAFKNIPPSQGPAGQPASMLLSHNRDLRDLIITSPDGRQIAFDVVRPDAGETLLTQQIQWNDTRAAGVYKITEGIDSTRYYVAEPSAEEWNSPPVDQQNLARLAETMDASLITSIEQYFELRTERAVGFEIWRWIWWCVLGLMVAERFVVWLLGRVS